jgi:hypothetical protein
LQVSQNFDAISTQLRTNASTIDSLQRNYFALETRNSVLESQNSALEQRISSLEQMFNGFHEIVARLQHQQQPHFFMQPGPTTRNLTLANAGNFNYNPVTSFTQGPYQHPPSVPTIQMLNRSQASAAAQPVSKLSAPLFSLPNTLS